MNNTRPPMDFAGSVLLILFLTAVVGVFLCILSMTVWVYLIDPAVLWLAGLFGLVK